MDNLSPVDTVSSQACYSLPIETTLPITPTKSFQSTNDTIEEVKVVEEKRNVFGRFYDWMASFFRDRTSKVEEPTPDTFKSAHRQIEEISRMQTHQKDSFEQELSELGLEAEALRLRLEQIGIRNTDIAFTNQQVLELHKLIEEVRSKIDEKLNQYLKASGRSKLFEKIGVGTSSLLLAVGVVGAAITFYTAGTAAAATVPITAFVQAFVGIVAGATTIAGAHFTRIEKNLESDKLGLTHERQVYHQHIEKFMQEIKDYSNAVVNSRREATQVESRRDQEAKDTFN